MTSYPKTMTHPHARKGSYKPVPGSGRAVRQDDGTPGEKLMAYQGTPDRLPPLFVENAEQEERARAKGYLDFGEAPPPVAGYSEYPLMLVHPKHVDAVPEERRPYRTTEGGPLEWNIIPGKPEQFPNVTVNDADQEEAWKAKGYERPGRADPQAVADARASPYVPGRTTSEWPKMVNGVLVEDPDAPPSGPEEYPLWITTGKHPDTGEAMGKTVASREEEIALCKKLDLPLRAALTKVPAEPEGAVTVTMSRPEDIKAMRDAGHEVADNGTLAPLTRGQKAAVTRAANKARKAGDNQAQA